MSSMQNRLRRCVGLVRAALLASVLGYPGSSVAQPDVTHPVDDFPDAQLQYRRFELAVSPTFTASCQKKEVALTCEIGGVPDRFARLLRAMRGGAITGVELIGRRGKSFIVRLDLASPALEFRSETLTVPPRWVLEVGIPRALSDGIEDETPFRPYPLAPRPFSPILPKSPVAQLPGKGSVFEAVNGCVKALEGGRYKAAMISCESAATAAANDVTARAVALMARGEAAAALGRQGKAPDLTTVTNALIRAESVAPTDEAKARFAVLQATIYEPMGYPSRGEVTLDDKMKSYRGTPAEPWILAGQIASAERQKQTEQAKKLVRHLTEMPGKNPNIGAALLYVGGQAYERKDWLEALELLDMAWRRWPDLTVANTEGLFHLAELYFRAGRFAEARSTYEFFIERHGSRRPQHVARVRLATLAALRDPGGARARLLDLAYALKEAEGQQLALLWAMRMQPDIKERRKALRQIDRLDPTDYVQPELAMERARSALWGGEVRRAEDIVRKILRTWPTDPLVKSVPQFFDRTLFLLVYNYVTLDRPLAAISQYFGLRARFERHRHRELMHLLIGRALRRLGMHEEAFTALQRGLGQGGEETHDPTTEAEVYLEMADALYRTQDRFRLREILKYLDRKYPGRFDVYTYWRARAASARWDGRLQEARDVLVYALNGPVAEDERADIAFTLADWYGEIGDSERAEAALLTWLELYDRSGKTKRSAIRRSAVWRLAELAFEEADWPAAIERFGDVAATYPTDALRPEAQYLKARALQSLGDSYAAVRLYDELTAAPDSGRFGQLAEGELAVLKWERRVSPAALRASGF